MWSLCAGGPAEEDDAPPVGAQGQHHGQGEDEGGPDQGGDFGNSAYRPARALARELIDEAAMEPEHQVELPRGVARSAFNVHNAKMPQAPGGGPVNAGAPGAPLSSFTSATFGRRGLGAQDTAESAAQAEVLGEELKKEGNALYNEGQLEAAELVYTEALKYSPKNHVIYSNRSMCYGRLGKYTDALADAKTVVAMMPTWAKGFARLAAAHEALGHDTEAIAAYEKARWLAGAHDNDPAGEAEYGAAVQALRVRAAASGYGDDHVT